MPRVISGFRCANVVLDAVQKDRLGQTRPDQTDRAQRLDPSRKSGKPVTRQSVVKNPYVGLKSSDVHI